MAITYNNLYMDIRQQLRRAGVEASTLEARELVCFAAGKTRQQLQRDGQLYVPPPVEEQARALVRRHLAGEPVAYLIGEWEFYGLPLDIDQQVLIPRADTETLVDCALPFLRQNPGSHQSMHRQPGAGPVCRVRVHRAGGGQPGGGLPGDPGGRF